MSAMDRLLQFQISINGSDLKIHLFFVFSEPLSPPQFDKKACINAICHEDLRPIIPEVPSWCKDPEGWEEFSGLIRVCVIWSAPLFLKPPPSHLLCRVVGRNHQTRDRPCL